MRVENIAKKSKKRKKSKNNKRQTWKEMIA